MNQRVRECRAQSSPAAGGRRVGRGFTLIELTVVIVIIAIVLSLVLVAATDAARRAEERATQTLITKLEGGLNDRLEALLQNRPDANYAHAYIAGIWYDQNGDMLPLLVPPDQLTGLPNAQVKHTQRAQAIAWYDYIKSELPDVFFTQPGNLNYPVNFAGVAYPGTPNDPQMQGNMMLPLGHMVLGPPPNGLGDGFIDNNGILHSSFPNLGFTGSGINGASYPIAAGIYKNLGYLPIGFDASDNNGNSLIDELGEGAPSNLQVGAVLALLGNHTHNTARSEMLYAILVEGSGPWGSVFSRDEFTDREVKDTDGDGLPEFIDAWGQPLQFFRWPLLYHSDLQRGQTILPTPGVANSWSLLPPFDNAFEERDQDPLDPNRQLMAPAWWAPAAMNGQLAANGGSPFNAGAASGAPVSASNGVVAFESFFHLLHEPLQHNGASQFYWDRGNTFPYRRVFYSKFLILSGGRDKQPGVFLYADSDMQGFAQNAAPFLIANENNALPFGLDVVGNGLAGFTTISTFQSAQPSFPYGPSPDPTHPSSYDIQQAAQDDISNHNLQSVSGIGGSR